MLDIVFTRFGIPMTIVSDNAKEFNSSDIVEWLKRLGCSKVNSPAYHPRANGYAERAVQTVKRAMKGWNPSIGQSFQSYLNRILMDHRANTRIDGETPSEKLNNRIMRYPIISDFCMGEKVLLSGRDNRKSEVTFIVKKGTNTAIVLKDDDTATLVSTSQLSRESIGDDENK